MEAGRQMKNIVKAILALVALVLAGGGTFWW
jgi:hypothetical protein